MTLEEIEDLEYELSMIPWKMGPHGHGPIWIIHKIAYPFPRTKIRRDRHYLYSQKVADIKGINYIEWWRITEKGIWGLSDDGLVSKSLRVDILNSGRILKFPTARLWVNYYPTPDTLSWHTWNARNTMESKHWSGNAQKRQKLILSRPRVRSGLKKLAEYWVKSLGRLSTADCREVCDLLFPKLKIDQPRAHIKNYLYRNYGVREEFEKMILEAFKEASLTPHKAAKYLKEAHEIAVKKKDPSSLIKIAKLIIDAYEKDETPKTTPDQWQHDAQLDEFYENKQQLLHDSGMNDMLILPKSQQKYIEAKLVDD